MMKQKWEAATYHSKDFDWDELREEVEKIPQFEFHFLPFAKVVTTFDDAQLDSGAWDQFHARHSTGKFFKERRYLLKEFPELGSCKENSKVLEVGCGNGSTALPLLCGRESIILYACDCSNEALERTKETIGASDSTFAIHRFHPFLCDFSTTGFPSWQANTDDAKSCIGGVDFVTLVFTLSALPPDRISKAIKECFSVLKPGGMLLFRDYGICDMTMLRFNPEQRVGYREYLRPDGTRAYFFCLDTVRSLTSVAGFIEVELEYCCIEAVNRRTGKKMKRVFVHGKFQKQSTLSFFDQKR
ncbi:hypothetical protein OROHE_005576 [Orobanche hederae]